MAFFDTDTDFVISNKKPFRMVNASVGGFASNPIFEITITKKISSKYISVSGQIPLNQWKDGTEIMAKINQLSEKLDNIETKQSEEKSKDEEVFFLQCFEVGYEHDKVVLMGLYHNKENADKQKEIWDKEHAWEDKGCKYSSGYGVVTPLKFMD